MKLKLSSFCININISIKIIETKKKYNKPFNAVNLNIFPKNRDKDENSNIKLKFLFKIINRLFTLF